jgi:hypothetical protein
MTKDKIVRIYDPFSEKFIPEQELKAKAIEYVKSCVQYGAHGESGLVDVPADDEWLAGEYEDWKADGFEGTLEDCAIRFLFMDAPRSEEMIKSELTRLRKERKPNDKFEAGMIRGKIEILEAVLNEIEFEDESELFDKVWFGRCDRLNDHNGVGKEAAQRLVEQYGEEELMAWANNYSDSDYDYGWGVLNGKFSAVRWVKGEEWDTLDT